MRIGGSLFLIAVGAILRFAITPHYSHGVNWATIGVILMIVGAVGALLTLAFLTTRRRTDVVVQDTRPAVGAPVDPRYGPTGGTRTTTYIEPGQMDPRI